jgi:hypothetical protein
MSDPKRWLDEDGGAGPGERAFLQQGLSMDPPKGAQDEVWMALCAQIGAAGGMAAAPAAAPQAAAAASPGAAGAGGAVATGKGAAAGMGSWGLAGAGVAKGLLIGLLCGGLAAGGYAAVAPSRAVPLNAPAAEAPFGISPPAPAPHSSPAPAASASAEPPDRTLDERPAASARPRITSAALGASAHASEAPSSPPPAESAATERESRLRDERRMLGEARNVLRGGQAAQAIQKLDEMRERFPDGVLAQEREALAIEALARTGRREAAAARAEAFLRAYPKSPHRQRIESFTH